EAKRALPSNGPTGLALSPAGDRLYALAAARLVALSPDTCEELRTGDRPIAVRLGSSAHSPVVSQSGLVLLVDRRNGTQVLAIDVEQRTAVARWTLRGPGGSPVDGRPSLQRSPDGRVAYVASSSVLYGEVWALNLAGEGVNPPEVVGRAASGP